MELLKFIFSSGWYFLGFIFLIVAIGNSLRMIIHGHNKEDNSEEEGSFNFVEFEGTDKQTKIQVADFIENKKITNFSISESQNSITVWYYL